ncbi:MAG: class I SAM-dependent methyltransferase [Patescibacteria group bacterium]
MLTKTDVEDIKFFEDNSRSMLLKNVQFSQNLTLSINILNYLRIANDVKKNLPNGSILDWGCGFGQMTYLLRRRGLECHPFDVRGDDFWPDVPLCNQIERILSTDKIKLPFNDKMFDGVLSCGVLEHITECGGDEIESIKEISRILKPSGKFFIYQLPQGLAWQENLVQRIGLKKYYHSRRYFKHEIVSILEYNGFNVIRIKRSNFIPKTLAGLPESIRNIYGRFSVILNLIDYIICQIPVINVFAGSLEILAVKK